MEVAYPADENAIEALQQLCGNLFSALLVPIAERAATSSVDLPGGSHVSGDSLLLSAIVLGAFGYFRTFDAPLTRSAVDCAGDEDAASASCELVLDAAPVDGGLSSGPIADLAESASTAAKPAPAAAASVDD